MKYDLAESILQRTMGHWDVHKMNSEMHDIQIISEIKYDDYQQYTHGMRYVESLALWMRQFKNDQDKDLAYKMIKDSLIFISEEEMRQLIALSYPVIMKKYLLEKTKKFCISHSIMDIEERKRIFSFYRRCSMFLGLSDGAHMDFFRRQNRDLSNEQVFVHYDFSKEKARSMQAELEEDRYVLEITERYPELLSKVFYNYFLIDDFAGSGKSYIRKDKESWNGKIKKVMDRIDSMNKDDTETTIHIVLYTATQRALETIRSGVEQFMQEKQGISITVDAIQIIEPIDWEQNHELDELLKRNYEEFNKLGAQSYNDKHFQKGEGLKPYYGFADCSLPLVLYHNTPNNTLPIIWYSWEDRVDALFPRVMRHKEI